MLQQPYLIWWVLLNFSLTFFLSPPPPPSHYSGLRCSHFRGNHWVKCRKNTRSRTFSYFSVSWANLLSSYGKISEVRATYSCLEHLSWLPNAKPEFSKESNTDMKSLWMISHRNRHSLVQVIITIFFIRFRFSSICWNSSTRNWQYGSPIGRIREQRLTTKTASPTRCSYSSSWTLIPRSSTSLSLSWTL